MNTKSTTYHHGDLPKAIVDCAMTLLEQQGSDAITLRTIASELGVSRTAPYRHFEDKQALLEALAIKGFELQWQTYDRFTESPDLSEFQRFGALGRAYVEFGVRHPNLYQLMFNNSGILHTQNPELLRWQKRSFERMSEMINKLSPHPLAEVEVKQMGHYVWSAVHGYCCLIHSSPEDVVEELVQAQDKMLVRIATGLFGVLPQM